MNQICLLHPVSNNRKKIVSCEPSKLNSFLSLVHQNGMNMQIFSICVIEINSISLWTVLSNRRRNMLEVEKKKNDEKQTKHTTFRLSYNSRKLYKKTHSITVWLYGASAIIKKNWIHCMSACICVCMTLFWWYFFFFVARLFVVASIVSFHLYTARFGLCIFRAANTVLPLLSDLLLLFFYFFFFILSFVLSFWIWERQSSLGYVEWHSTGEEEEKARFSSEHLLSLSLSIVAQW